MFTLQCVCGNELLCSGEGEGTIAWQCDVCGRWYDFFGVEIPEPSSEPPKSFYDDYDDDD